MEAIIRLPTIDPKTEIYRAVTRCRVCGGGLDLLHDFGIHALSGRFPSPGEEVPKAPLSLHECSDCDLIQIGQTVDAQEMFRDGYGYLSGVNPMMRKHLAGVVSSIITAPKTMHSRRERKIWVDIGCNDNTLLKSVPDDYYRVGYDPITGQYPEIDNIKEYFSAKHYRSGPGLAGNASVVTSIAMFYDLDDPVLFSKMVKSILAPEGIWVVEVGYAGDLINGAWDAVCHEHLCYYTPDDIAWIVSKAGLRVFRVNYNPVNGGSFQAWICHDNASTPYWFGGEPKLDTSGFSERVKATSSEIRDTVKEFDTVDVYGASTKGNTLLQTCGLDCQDIRWAADRNPDKVGRFTPGTLIPIVSEEQSRSDPPDAYLVLPWHFREAIIERESGPRLIFPLPQVEVL